MTIRDLKAWDIVRDYNFNIDSLDSVSYMFFEKDGVNIAELELVDYENYLIIEKEIGISDLHNYIHDTSNNALLCQKGYQDINFLIEGEWKAFI